MPLADKETMLRLGHLWKVDGIPNNPTFLPNAVKLVILHIAQLYIIIHSTSSLWL